LGLKWAFNPDAKRGQRTISLVSCGRFLFGRNATARRAFNSYDLAGGGQRWKSVAELVNRPEAKLVEYDFQTREAVINYIRKRGTITPNPSRLVDGEAWYQLEPAPKSE